MKAPLLKTPTSPRRRTAQADSSAPAEKTSPTARVSKTRMKVKAMHTTAPDKSQALRPVTTIEASVDVGFGNQLFIRGQGDGLSWEQGQPLTCLEASRWVWSSERVQGAVIFKLLLNDAHWAQGDDLKLEAGRTLEVVSCFA